MWPAARLAPVRTADDVRHRWLEMLPTMFTRTGMWAKTGGEMDNACVALLRDLCFLDENDDEPQRVLTAIGGRFGSTGVDGYLAGVFGGRTSRAAEVASVFAEHFHRLGYLTLARVLDGKEFAPLHDVDVWVGGRDVRHSEVEAAFGGPSLIVDKRVWCYAPQDGSGWVFFDGWDDAPTRYSPESGGFTLRAETDLLVRDVRVPAATYGEGILLTRFGEAVRWNARHSRPGRRTD